MAVKNSVFGKKWVSSEVTGIKITFLAKLEAIWIHILALKIPKYGIHETNF